MLQYCWILKKYLERTKSTASGVKYKNKCLRNSPKENAIEEKKMTCSVRIILKVQYCISTMKKFILQMLTKNNRAVCKICTSNYFIKVSRNHLCAIR